ncbi:MAG: hypothetical protein AAGF89_03950, partial [Bacteroidota bacterium]
LNIDFVMGLDVLMVDMSGYECSFEEFGINQYYGRGQAYAYLGIKGEVGGRLFGKERYFTFAHLEAAADIDFKGPKPTWMKGRAAIRGELLGGLIEFDTRVEFERGEELACTQGGGDIFEDIPIVEDFDPQDGDTDRSVFTSPQMAFNFPREPFSIEEETDVEDQFITQWYGYEIVDFTVRTREEGEDWKTFNGDHQGPIYDQAGYSAYYELAGQLPEFSEVEIELRARGMRLGSDNPDDLIETYDVQTYTATFETGEAPDHVMKGSIHRSIPFQRQRYFLETENGQRGYLRWFTDQNQALFRNKPTDRDGLDPKGNYAYVARFTEVATQAYEDVPISNADYRANGGVQYPIPTSFLQPETIYELDLVRIYTPPPGTEENNTIVVEETLSLHGAGGGGNGGGNNLQLNAPLLANNNNNNGPGLNILIQGVNNDSPQPIPNAGLQLQANANYLDNPISPPIPGGSLEGFKKNARKVKNRGAVSQTVEKSLLPHTQFYFRTSKFTTKAEKTAGITVKDLNNVPYQEHVVDVDDLHAAVDGKPLRLPYVFLDAPEGFDRIESQFRRESYTAYDQGQIINPQPYVANYTPLFRFTGTDDWRSQTFAGDGNQGLFRYPFGANDNTWCNFTFQDPDQNNNFLEDGLPKPNAPLHSSNLPQFPWWAYQKAAPNQEDFFEREQRYTQDGPFGSRPARRRLPLTSMGAAYDFEKPLIEFLHHAPGQLPTDLAGYNVRHTNVLLSAAEVLQVLPPLVAQPQPTPTPPGNGGYTLADNLVLPPFIGGLGNISLKDDGGVKTPSPSPFIPNLPQDVDQGHPGYIPLVDFTEWVTFKDYILYREMVDEGLLHYAQESQTIGNLSTVLYFEYPLNCGDDALPLPGENDLQFAGKYNFWLRYYKPIRAYFDQKYQQNNIPGFPYHPRPAGNTTVRLAGKSLNYQHPKQN